MKDYLTEEKTLYEKRMQEVMDNDKVVFYDYIMYKKAAGWRTKFTKDDWSRPFKIARAKYHAAFLQDLPDYNFLGIPIKTLLKSRYSDGYCHACAVALSLCFDEFELITCNLSNYADHYTHKTDRKVDEFEHTFTLVDLNGKKVVIDTTWGILTDYDTYNYIFDLTDIRSISSRDLKNTEIYQFVEARKYDVGPSYESELKKDSAYSKYYSMICEYMNLCKNYINPDNKHLQDFMNRCLYRTSNSACIDDWRITQYYQNSHQIQYPAKDLFSIVDDEFDFTLEGKYAQTKSWNERMLENYHKKKPFKQRVLEKIKKLTKNTNN